MANTSIFNAFNRMWQHIFSALGTKVSFDEEQTLTEEQKLQARENIGISETIVDTLASLDIITTLTEDDNETLVDSDGNILVSRNNDIFLPEVTDENNGGVLKVVDGKWTIDTIPDSAFISVQDETTFEEIQEAYNAGRVVFCKVTFPAGSRRIQTIIPLSYYSDDLIRFNGTYRNHYIEAVLYSDNTWENDADNMIIGYRTSSINDNGSYRDDYIVDAGAVKNYVSEKMDVVIADKADRSELFSGSWNDLTDKPFYEETDCDVMYTWDGNNLTYTDPEIYRVSKDVPMLEDLMGGKVFVTTHSVEGGIEGAASVALIDDSSLVTVQDGVCYGVEWDDGSIAAYIVYDTWNGVERGLYLAKIASDTFARSITYTMETMPKLDERYISDAIARVGDIPEIPEIDYPVTSVDGMIGDIVLEDTYETKTDAQAKLVESKEYTDTAIANLVNSAPETLDTLGELATAFKENADVVDALDAAIANKADKSELFSGSWNDLTDRPFYEDGGWTTVIWDGNTDGKTACGQYYLVSTNLPDRDEDGCPEVLGSTCAYNRNGVETVETVDDLEGLRAADGIYYRFTSSDWVRIVYFESSLNGITFSEPGIYFRKTTSTYTSRFTYGKDATIKTLDEKYIPDTIARISDLDTPKTEFILASTTEGSNKKFKLSIDDNGVLTTTEIVESAT